jgi:hypothetical protein
MKTIRATLNFVGRVHTIYVHATDDEWADPTFKIKLKNRLEANPVVLRIDESDEPDYKAERDAARKEAKELGRQLAAALKRLSAESAVEPCFAILKP